MMMTLTKIAKEAHVSVSTASKAFSGSNEVSEETRELVFRVAKSHGCFKKFYNAKYPKLVIAVIAPEFSSSHYTRYLSLIQQQLTNCELCVSTSNFSDACEKDLIDYYYKHSNIDGMILIDPSSVPPATMEIPVAVLCSAKKISTHSAHYTSVYIDYHTAIKEALSYLNENGINDVGFLGETHTQRKEDLFRKMTAEVGIPISERNIIRSSDRFETGGYSAIEKILQDRKPPRAMLCAYDNMAIGAITCLKDHGYRVPEDVAILGMDDLPEACFLNPPLASITSSPEERCRLVAEAILRRINAEPVDNEITIAARFQLRRSFCVDL